MLAALAILALSQTSPVMVVDPANASKRVTTSDAGTKVALDVALLGGAVPAKKASAALAQAINCATTATALPAAPLANRVSTCVQNMGAAVVYVGHSGVTTSTGLALAPASGTTPGGSYCDDNGSQPLFCIVASGAETVRLLEN